MALLLTCPLHASSTSLPLLCYPPSSFFFFFFFNDPATTEIYTLSLHDALPICVDFRKTPLSRSATERGRTLPAKPCTDRKSTRLNSSHVAISYAVFCLKKKKKKKNK